MAYGIVGVGALGLGKAATGCETGLETSAQGFCCETPHWHNATYRHFIGAEALRYHNEKRVREALRLLSGEKLEQMRWKAEGDLKRAIRIDPKLTKAVTRATRNWQAIYPASRWHSIKHQIQKGQRGNQCGPYDGWVAAAAPETAEYARALSEVRTALQASGGSATADIAKAAAETKAMTDVGYDLIATVPGSYDTARVSFMPKAEDLVALQGDTIVAVGWTQPFLDRFAPYWQGAKMAATRSKYLTRKTTAPEPASPAQAAVRVAPAPETPWLAIGAGVAILGAGAGYAWWKLKR